MSQDVSEVHRDLAKVVGVGENTHNSGFFEGGELSRSAGESDGCKNGQRGKLCDGVGSGVVDGAENVD
jgi:hypothetical protein